jgi:nicotinate-nucleotide adenylyltransferase
MGEPHRRESVVRRAQEVFPPGTALFGGTFDPIHNAHLEIARAAADRFDLAKILFVPAANPPHKPGGVIAPWEDRVRMVELACEIDPRFEVSRIEAAIDNSTRSYSIDTIEKLNGPLSFLIGADAFREIRTWHRWRDVVASVEFIVVTRPDLNQPGATWDIPPGAIVHELTGLELPVSSSEIRRQVIEDAAQVPVPEAVLAYIREHGLYRSQTT